MGRIISVLGIIFSAGGAIICYINGNQTGMVWAISSAIWAFNCFMAEGGS